MLPELKLITFVVASFGLAWASRGSLRDVRSHGFYRFFAWEAIVALILINLDDWYYKPFSAHQIVAWLLLFVSAFLVIHGVQLLRTVGKPDSQRKDPALLGMEKTTELVTVGAYRYIRHPLYSSLLFLAWGAFFKHPAWIGLSLASLATLLLSVTAKIEEAENMRYFGEAYEIYMRQTKMFVPFLF
jgi:protein-S-isoprenylcysteine O-methyltransferase Ste14